MEYTNEKIDRQFILSRISEQEIFHKYLGINPNLKEFYCNPLRIDIHPSCRFYIKNDRVRFKDFATGQNIDCFDVIQLLYKVNYPDALEIVIRDFKLLGGRKKRIVKPISSFFFYRGISFLKVRVKRRKFDKVDLKYWNSYYIDVDRLKKYNVSSLDILWINDRITYTHSSNDRAYVYYFGNYNYKIYYPFRKKCRFAHFNSTLIQGYNQLPKLGRNLIITKSYKDVMCIDIFSKEFDMYAIAPMSESIMITEDFFKDLYNRFDNIYSLMDRDKSGIMMTIKLRNAYNTIPILFNKDDKKDFSDNLKYLGIDKMRDKINNYLINKK